MFVSPSTSKIADVSFKDSTDLVVLDFEKIQQMLPIDFSLLPLTSLNEQLFYKLIKKGFIDVSGTILAENLNDFAFPKVGGRINNRLRDLFDKQTVKIFSPFGFSLKIEISLKEIFSNLQSVKKEDSIFLVGSSVWYFLGFDYFKLCCKSIQLKNSTETLWDCIESLEKQIEERFLKSPADLDFRITNDDIGISEKILGLLVEKSLLSVSFKEFFSFSRIKEFLSLHVPTWEEKLKKKLKIDDFIELKTISQKELYRFFLGEVVFTKMWRQKNFSAPNQSSIFGLMDDQLKGYDFLIVPSYENSVKRYIAPRDSFFIAFGSEMQVNSIHSEPCQAFLELAYNGSTGFRNSENLLPRAGRVYYTKMTKGQILNEEEGVFKKYFAQEILEINTNKTTIHDVLVHDVASHFRNNLKALIALSLNILFWGCQKEKKIGNNETLTENILKGLVQKLQREVNIEKKDKVIFLFLFHLQRIMKGEDFQAIQNGLHQLKNDLFGVGLIESSSQNGKAHVGFFEKKKVIKIALGTHIYLIIPWPEESNLEQNFYLQSEEKFASLYTKNSFEFERFEKTNFKIVSEQKSFLEVLMQCKNSQDLIVDFALIPEAFFKLPRHLQKKYHFELGRLAEFQPTELGECANRKKIEAWWIENLASSRNFQKRGLALSLFKKQIESDRERGSVAGRIQKIWEDEKCLDLLLGLLSINEECWGISKEDRMRHIVFLFIHYRSNITKDLLEYVQRVLKKKGCQISDLSEFYQQKLLAMITKQKDLGKILFTFDRVYRKGFVSKEVLKEAWLALYSDNFESQMNKTWCLYGQKWLGSDSVVIEQFLNLLNHLPEEVNHEFEHILNFIPNHIQVDNPKIFELKNKRKGLENKFPLTLSPFQSELDQLRDTPLENQTSFVQKLVIKYPFQTKININFIKIIFEYGEKYSLDEFLNLFSINKVREIVNLHPEKWHKLLLTKFTNRANFYIFDDKFYLWFFENKRIISDSNSTLSWNNEFIQFLHSCINQKPTKHLKLLFHKYFVDVLEIKEAQEIGLVLCWKHNLEPQRIRRDEVLDILRKGKNFSLQMLCDLGERFKLIENESFVHSILERCSRIEDEFIIQEVWKNFVKDCYSNIFKNQQILDNVLFFLENGKLKDFWNVLISKFTIEEKSWLQWLKILRENKTLSASHFFSFMQIHLKKCEWLSCNPAYWITLIIYAEESDQMEEFFQILSYEKIERRIENLEEKEWNNVKCQIAISLLAKRNVSVFGLNRVKFFCRIFNCLEPSVKIEESLNALSILIQSGAAFSYNEVKGILSRAYEYSLNNFQKIDAYKTLLLSLQITDIENYSKDINLLFVRILDYYEEKSTVFLEIRNTFPFFVYPIKDMYNILIKLLDEIEKNEQNAEIYLNQFQAILSFTIPQLEKQGFSLKIFKVFINKVYSQNTHFVTVVKTLMEIISKHSLTRFFENMIEATDLSYSEKGEKTLELPDLLIHNKRRIEGVTGSIFCEFWGSLGNLLDHSLISSQHTEEDLIILEKINEQLISLTSRWLINVIKLIHDWCEIKKSQYSTEDVRYLNLTLHPSYFFNLICAYNKSFSNHSIVFELTNSIENNQFTLSILSYILGKIRKNFNTETDEMRTYFRYFFYSQCSRAMFNFFCSNKEVTCLSKVQDKAFANLLQEMFLFAMSDLGYDPSSSPYVELGNFVPNVHCFFHYYLERRSQFLLHFRIGDSAVKRLIETIDFIAVKFLPFIKSIPLMNHLEKKYFLNFSEENSLIFTKNYLKKDQTEKELELQKQLHSQNVSKDLVNLGEYDFNALSVHNPSKDILKDKNDVFAAINLFSGGILFPSSNCYLCINLSQSSSISNLFIMRLLPPYFPLFTAEETFEIIENSLLNLTVWHKNQCVKETRKIFGFEIVRFSVKTLMKNHDTQYILRWQVILKKLLEGYKQGFSVWLKCVAIQPQNDEFNLFIMNFIEDFDECINELRVVVNSIDILCDKNCLKIIFDLINFICNDQMLKDYKSRVGSITDPLKQTALSLLIENLHQTLSWFEIHRSKHHSHRISEMKTLIREIFNIMKKKKFTNVAKLFSYFK